MKWMLHFWLGCTLTWTGVPPSRAVTLVGGTNDFFWRYTRGVDIRQLDTNKLVASVVQADAKDPNKRYDGIAVMNACVLVKLGHTNYYDRIENLILKVKPEKPSDILIGCTLLAHVGDARAAKFLGSLFSRPNPPWWADAMKNGDPFRGHPEAASKGLCYMAVVGTLPEVGPFPKYDGDTEDWRVWWREHGDQALAIMEARQGKARVTNTAPHAVSAESASPEPVPAADPAVAPAPSVAAPQSTVSWWTLLLIAGPAVAVLIWLVMSRSSRG